MRIAWVSHRTIKHPLAGGAERTTYELGSRMAKAGHEFHLISVGSSGEESPNHESGIEYHCARSSIGLHLALPKALALVRPEVVVYDLAQVVPWPTSRFSPLPAVGYFRHLHRRTLLGQVSYPIALGLTGIERLYPILLPHGKVVTETRGGLEDLGDLGFGENRTRRIPPGVDTVRFFPRTKTPKPSLVYFGGLKAYKRPAHSLLLTRALLDMGFDVRLDVVGDGPMRARLELLGRELGLDQRIAFLGRLPDDDLVRTVGSAWINVHCAVSEGWCLSAMEAAACGTPTVAYAVPGIRESIGDGLSGRLAASGNAGELALAAATMLNSRDAISRTARKYSEGFSWEQCTKDWLLVLEEAMTKQKFTAR